MDGVEGEGGGVHRLGAQQLRPGANVEGQQPGRPGARVSLSVSVTALMNGWNSEMGGADPAGGVGGCVGRGVSVSVVDAGRRA